MNDPVVAEPRAVRHPPSSIFVGGQPGAHPHVSSGESPERHWRAMPLGKPLLDILERMTCGGVVLDASGNALQINPTASRLLQLETGSANRSANDLEWVRGAIKRLLNRSTEPRRACA